MHTSARDHRLPRRDPDLSRKIYSRLLCSGPAQPLTTAGEELDDRDRDLDHDLSDVCIFVTVAKLCALVDGGGVLRVVTTRSFFLPLKPFFFFFSGREALFYRAISA